MKNFSNIKTNNNLPNNIIDNIDTIFIIFAYMLVLGAMTYRLFYGIEITDESLYIAEGYIVTQGATPYVDMWLHASGFALLNAPFIWIYTFITESTSGIFLYFRSISLLVRLSTIILICWIMKPYINPKITALWHLPFLAFVPHSIITMSYDTWTITLLLLCSVTTVRSVLSDKYRIKFGAISGGLFALVILCYPILIILGIILLFLIFIYEIFYKLEHKTLFGFLSGGLIFGFILLLILTLHSGNIYGIINGLNTIINDNPYMRSSKGINEQSLNLFASYMSNWVIVIIIPLIFIKITSFNKNQKTFIVLLILLIYIIFFSFKLFNSFIQLIDSNSSALQITSILCRLFFPIIIPIALLVNRKKQLVISFLFFIYLPALIFFLIANFFVFNGMNQRYYFLIQGTLLIVPFVYFLSEEKISKYNIMIYFLILFNVMTLSSGFLLNYYGYIYREEPLKYLSYKINYGIFFGIHTTSTKGKGIISLEKTIKNNTSKYNNILFMDCVPMAYLMTNARHCSPTTWDMLSYTYGTTDDFLLQKYFKTVGRTPDKIIYIFTGRDKILSIDSKDYKFSHFVNKNYKLTANINTYYPVKIYEKTKD